MYFSNEYLNKKSIREYYFVITVSRLMNKTKFVQDFELFSKIFLAIIFTNGDHSANYLIHIFLYNEHNSKEIKWKW